MSEHDLQNESDNSTGVDALLTRHGGLSYLEIPTDDARKSADFYASVLGWSIERADTDDPRFHDAAGHLIGRWTTDRKPGLDFGLLAYFYVEDVDAAVERAIASGGEIVKPIQAEGNLWIATISDPAGNAIGLWQVGLRSG